MNILYLPLLGGDPLSPGMTIMACAWMEREWMSNLKATDRLFFKGARYMDDIMLLYSKNPCWEGERFLRDFTRSECYWAPLKLERAEEGQFLETTYSKIGSEISYRLKNTNEKSIKVWRYHHCYLLSRPEGSLLTLRFMEELAAAAAAARADEEPSELDVDPADMERNAV